MQHATLLKADFGTQEWHDIRKSGIGGSDAAAVIGLSKFKSPYQLYLEKIGEAPPVLDNWDMQRGRALEPVIRQNYSDRTGRVVRLLDGVLRDNENPFMLGNFDGLTDDERLVEIKAPRYDKEWGEVGTDQVPQEYLIQVQHYLAITRFPVADVVVSFGGGAPMFYEVPADKELQGMIIDAERNFWEMVEQRNPPEPKTAEDVAQFYRRASTTSIVATPEVEAHLIELRQAKNDLAIFEEKKELIETQIKMFMGENDTLVHSTGGTLATWKQAKGAERLDGKAIKENEPDIYERYIKIGEPTRRFLLK